MSARVARFGYQPALDGVRGVAVALVLCFHSGWSWMTGGYVGVSVFFTLSGFLITTLAVRERDGTGRLDVPAFYARRLRRLLPASVLCVGGVVVAASLGAFEGATGLRRDVVAALAQVYNWSALTGERSYAEVIGGGARFAPLEHYWSLAIEEQFYWLWPLALLVVLRWSKRTRTMTIAGVTLLSAIAAPLIARRWGGDAAYWSTPSRLAEIMVGATTALALDQRRATRRALPRDVRWLAPIALAVIVVVAVVWPSGSGPAYQGWLPVFALASAALILGLQVDGPIRRLLARPAIVSLGVISYGVYLYHWPVFGILDEQRLGWHGAPLFGVRVVVTLGLAVGSYLWIEEPIRVRRWQFGHSVAGAVAVTVPLALVALVLPIERPGFWVGSAEAREAVAIDTDAPDTPLVAADDDADGDDDPASSTDVTAPSAATPPSEPASTDPVSTEPSGTDPISSAPAATSPTTDAPASTSTTSAATSTSSTLPTDLSRPARILVIGDSTASAVGEGLVRFAADHPDLAQVSILWSPACGFVRSGNEVGDLDDHFLGKCAEVRAALPTTLAQLQPDVVVLMQTIADGAQRTFTDGRAPIGPSDPGFDEFLAREYEAQLFDLLSWGASRIAWIVPPPQLVAGGSEPFDAASQRAVRRAIETVAGDHPGVVTVVDVDAWQSDQPSDLRPDGLHYSADGAARLADELLAPTLLGLAVA